MSSGVQQAHQAGHGVDQFSGHVGGGPPGGLGGRGRRGGAEFQQQFGEDPLVQRQDRRAVGHLLEDRGDRQLQGVEQYPAGGHAPAVRARDGALGAGRTRATGLCR